jgi:hypothetical protein
MKTDSTQAKEELFREMAKNHAVCLSLVMHKYFGNWEIISIFVA